MNVCDIKNIESEAGIIASIVMKPEFTFYSEQLKPNHFSDSQNAYIYYAVCELAKRGIEKVDAYNITNILNAKEATKKQTETITIQALNDLIEVAKVIARESVEEYKLLVNNVLDAAFRRDTYNRLVECERLCFNNCKHHTSVSIDDITDWDLTKFFPTLHPDDVYAPLFDNEFWKTVQPKDGASRFIKALKDDGYAVYICTTSNYKTLETKMESVLFKHFDFLSWKDVIITSNKQLINADFLVDDGVHNLIGGSYQGILMDAPHNRKFNEKEHDIIRVKSWNEIYNIIKRLTQED